MIRELALNEVQAVSGGASYIQYTDIVNVYPPEYFGEKLVGWSEAVTYETTTWTEYKGMFTSVEHVVTTPILNIQPLYVSYY